MGNPKNDVLVLVGLFSVKCVSLEACGVNTLLKSWKQKKRTRTLIYYFNSENITIRYSFLSTSFIFLRVTVFYLIYLKKSTSWWTLSPKDSMETEPTINLLGKSDFVSQSHNRKSVFYWLKPFRIAGAVCTSQEPSNLLKSLASSLLGC